ncbi:MAG: ABC transporter permease [Azospirillaceae bacterium]
MAETTAAPATADGDERLSKTPFVKKALGRPELGAVAGAVLVFVFFGIVAGGTGMFSARGIINFLEVSSLLGILAIGVALLMIGGEFDLSIGSMIAAAGMVVAIPAVVWGWPMWLCILLAFGVAVLVGLGNGWLVVTTGLPSFIVTLGGLFILRGATIGFTRLLTGRTQVSGVGDAAEGDFLAPLFGGEVLQGLFVWLSSIGVVGQRLDGLPLVSGVPMSIVWFFVLGAVATWVLLRTRYGNWIYAAGGDKSAARNVGVPVNRVKISLFVITASVATLVAVIQVLDAGSADTNRGLLKELEAISAAVIGGCLLTGGYGSAIGAMLGALIFGTVQMGIFYTGVNTDWFKVFLGAMLVIAVLSNNYIRKKATEAR